MLHDAGDKNIRAVTNYVNLQLCSHHVFIDQNGVFNALRENDAHILPHIVVIMSDGHILSADDVGRTQQHGVAELRSIVKRLLSC